MILPKNIREKVNIKEEG
ncbi:MAG: hypothetical protein ACUX7D_02360 [Candidatus Methanodesulfokora washburnensis]